VQQVMLVNDRHKLLLMLAFATVRPMNSSLLARANARNKSTF
jgi:hypothetical protein